MRILSLFLFLSLLFTACNGSAEATSEQEEQTETEEAPTEEAATVTIAAMPESVDFPDAAIRDISYKDGAFSYTLAEGDYQLGLQTPDADALMCANSAKGQHIHLIVDNEPYAAKYEADFEYEISDGEHYILTFLSRSYHLSLKHPEASRAMKVVAKEGAFESTADITEPMLFYSRPKGTYTGPNDTKNIMLDFYPVNVELGDDYKVKLEVNGEEMMMIDRWQPYFLNGLPMGENTITLTLVDGSGQKIDTPLNPVSRTFTLKESPVTE